MGGDIPGVVRRLLGRVPREEEVRARRDPLTTARLHVSAGGRREPALKEMEKRALVPSSAGRYHTWTLRKPRESASKRESLPAQSV